LQILKTIGRNLPPKKNLSSEEAIEAVKNNGYALRYVEEGLFYEKLVIEKYDTD